MKITSISAQVRNPDRVNVSVDGAYLFSLDIYQVAELGVRVGGECTEEELAALKCESVFGKLYTKALEYSMLRPHSAKEMRDYLWRKTRETKYKTRSGEIRQRQGVSQEIADRVYDRLSKKGYIDDRAFTRWWVENRNVSKGVSRRKLQAELSAKGVAPTIMDEIFTDTARNDKDELLKIVTKKRKNYPDEQKLVQYLARQGFRFDDIKTVLADCVDDES